jgi:lipopolysaccharide/colanic/teichoic acid biosynthesis glycosyltransferase
MTSSASWPNGASGRPFIINRCIVCHTIVNATSYNLRITPILKGCGRAVLVSQYIRRLATRNWNISADRSEIFWIKKRKSLCKKAFVTSVKRLFDLIFSFLGLLFLCPIFLIVTVLLRLDGGPAFFRQERVGLRGKRFWVFKFRSMVADENKRGVQVTAENDARITSLGRLLRKTKLDELPQLFNVLKGDMSIVGPRPEVPRYVAIWSEEDRKNILSVRPGITDYATLYYHDEQAVLARAMNTEKTYIQDILPHKLRLYKDYVRDQNVGLDVRLILATLARIINRESRI